MIEKRFNLIREGIVSILVWEIKGKQQQIPFNPFPVFISVLQIVSIQYFVCGIVQWYDIHSLHKQNCQYNCVASCFGIFCDFIWICENFIEFLMILYTHYCNVRICCCILKWRTLCTDKNCFHVWIFILLFDFNKKSYWTPNLNSIQTKNRGHYTNCL